MPDDFTAVRSVGGLLAPDLLRRIAAGDQELGLLAPQDYGLAASDRLGEAAARAWARAKAYWAAFRAATDPLPPGETGVTETRQQWLLPLLRDLGYRDPEFTAAAETLGGRGFVINYRAGGVPLHLVSLRQELDAPARLGGGRQAPPHALLQDYLNLSDALYGIVSNGLLLRLLRDNASLTRQAYVEFDLQAIFEGGVYSDYVLLYLVLHRSRLPGEPLPLAPSPARGGGTRPDRRGPMIDRSPARGGGTGTEGRWRGGERRTPHAEEAGKALDRPLLSPLPEPGDAAITAAGATPAFPLPAPGRGPGGEVPPCPLELWRAKAESQGTRALEKLRDGVEAAVRELGEGFLRHPANDALRQRLAQGELTALDYYSQLLRLIYRLIFLFAAEERNLLFPTEAPARGRAIYGEHYAASLLRDLAPRQRSDDRHDDLWRGFLVTCRLVAEGAPGLGLPALGGGLFDAAACPDLDAALLRNSSFAEALVQLSWVRLDRRARAGGRQRVNYRDMDTEELGGVYEALLERRPRLSVEPPSFALAGSGQRKQTGSYYTPPALVRELIASALEPVIADLTPVPSPMGRGGRVSGDGEQTGGRELLGLAVCDPACGSGHFLLAAARKLADALARREAGGREPTPKELTLALRRVIRACLYGVDANPLAVDLCKVALWLEGQAPGLPLTYLDHRIKLGNSLIGATPELMQGRLPDATEREAGLPDAAFAALSGDSKEWATGVTRRNRQARRNFTIAESGADWRRAQERLGRAVARIAAAPERQATEVREQRAAYAAFEQGELETARAALDAWTAAFFWPLRAEAPEPPTSDLLRAAGPARPPALAEEQRSVLRGLRERHRFFHWPLEFPDVFARGGFDCVLGNPPWERIKLQEQEFFAERDTAIATAPNKAARDRLIGDLKANNPRLYQAFLEARADAEGQSKFVRGSGRFPLTAVGNVNLYPLFAEHDRNLLNANGRAGVIVPTGIATDDSTKRFFQSVVDASALATLFDFENREGLFAAVDSRYKFCLLTLSGRPAPQSDLAFMLTNTAGLRDERRRFRLGPDDFALLNPNTRTCPIFRTRADAELTRAIYRRVPVLIDEGAGANPWGVSFLRMFDMSNDSHLFHGEPGPGRLPLYEAKLFHQFNHRWATYAPGADARDATPAELADPSFTVRPRYWVDAREVEERLKGKWERGWLLGWRRNARNTDERTLIATILPAIGAGDSVFFALPHEARGVDLGACLVGNLNSLPLDYCARQKVSGVNMNFYLVEQFPILPPTAYTADDLDFIVPRVLELTYTAWDLRAFARELGNDGAPFGWDAERRAVLRAELDAWYAALYGLERDELRYVLDPSDVYGPEFPGETFRVLKEREVKQFGEYRTRRLVLEAWDRLGLAARMREGRYAVEGEDAEKGSIGGPRLRSAAKLRGGTAVPDASRDRSRPSSLAADRSRGPASSPSRAPAPAGPSPSGVREGQQGMFWQGPLVGGAPQPTLFDQPPATDDASRSDGEPVDAAPPAEGITSAPTPEPSADAAPRSRAELRRLIVEEAARLLGELGPLSSPDLTRRMAALDPSVNAFLVANVLQTEGVGRIGFDGKAQKYLLKRQGS